MSLVAVLGVLSVLLYHLVEGGKDSCSATCEFFEDEVLFNLVRSFRWGCSPKDHDAKCAVNRITEIQEWLKKDGISRILVTGKMGSGKSTFIKGLTENYIPDQDNLLPHTVEVTPHDGTHEGLYYVFYDTPGLKDSEDSTNDYDYLTQMVEKNGEPHLLIFAVKMDDYVFQDDDIEAIANITSAFGWGVWKKAMFILTFANMVYKVGQDPKSVENRLHFSNKYDKHYEDIANALRRNNVEEEVINQIPVVAVGLVSEPELKANRRGGTWIENFWKDAFKILRKPKKTYDTPADNEYTDEQGQGEKTEEKKKGSSSTPQAFSLVTLLLIAFIHLETMSIPSSH